MKKSKIYSINQLSVKGVFGLVGVAVVVGAALMSGVVQLSFSDNVSAATCTGTVVNVSPPASSFDATVAAGVEGTCYQFANGTYDFHNVAPKNNMKFYGDSRAGVLVNGDGHENAFHGVAEGVEIRDMTFYGFNDMGLDASGNPAGGNPQEQAPIRGTPAIWQSNAGNLATNWVIDNIESHSNIAAGIFLGDNFTVTNSTFRNNDVTGLGGDSFVGGLVQGNTVHGNGYNGAGGAASNGGGMKFTQAGDYTNRLVVDNNNVYDNIRGIWCDIACHGFDVTNNTVSTSLSSGIIYEVSDDAYFANNTVTDSAAGWSGMTSDWSAGGIISAESKDVLIENNTVTGSHSAITIRQTHRPTNSTEEGFWTGITDITLVSENVTVRSNDINTSTHFGVANAATGFGEITNPSSLVYECNTFDDASGMVFFWVDNVQQSFAQWQAAGRDDGSNCNNPPTNITFSATTIQENNAQDTMISSQTTTDPDSSDTHTYSIACTVPGADDSRFQIISGGAHDGHLHSNYVFDYESPVDTGDTAANNTYEVCVRTTDNGSPVLSYDQNVIITVTNDVSDDDTTPPVITLTGSNPQTIDQGTSYSELGATANDNVDGDITSSIVIDSSSVNTAVIGSYTVTYNVSDSSSNAATELTRTVDVVAAPDTTPPVITLNGPNPLDVVQGSIYSDPGATANDNVDGDITSSIVVGGDTVDPNTIAAYTVTYNVQDAANNNATEVTRTVNVIAADTTPPVITLTGSNPQTIDQGTSYSELGATANDNVDGDITSSIVIDSSSVNTAVIGSYTVTYNVQDAANNNATEVTRTVDVVVPADTTPPTLNYSGPSTIVLNEGDTYTPPTVTAQDDVDGDITSSIVVSGDTVDANTASTYQLYYDVSDSSSNAATQLNITVVVNPAPTADGDGIDDSVEDAAPNSGDANDDGIQDSSQPNVGSIVNTNNNEYLSLQLLDQGQSSGTPTDCDSINSLSTQSEASLTEDTDYDYPIGLIDFNVACSNPGDTTSITIYLDQLYDTTNWTIRKYSGSTYQDMPQASFATATVGTNTVTTIVYDITDGSSLDTDGTVNGTIVDPVGPAVLGSTVGDTADLADTGSSAIWLLAAGLGVAATAGVSYMVRDRVVYRGGF